MKRGLSLRRSSAQLALHSCHKQHITQSLETGVSFSDATSCLSFASAFFHCLQVIGGQIVEWDPHAVQVRGGIAFRSWRVPRGCGQIAWRANKSLC